MKGTESPKKALIRKNCRFVLVTFAMLSLAAQLAPIAGAAQSSGFSIISPAAAKAQTGLNYGEWSGVWWQYVVSKPVNDPNNPLLSPTGDGCFVDQSSSSTVFFLVGAAGSGTVTRNACSVPAGKVLFFPLVNYIDLHVPGDGLDTPELVRKDLLSYIGPVNELHASIDGVAVGNLNPQS